MKIMKFFTNEFDVGNEILISPIRCYQCHHNFNNKPFFLPIDYNCELNRFKVTGNFCSPNCVKTYAINSKIYQNRLSHGDTKIKIDFFNKVELNI